VFDSFVCVCVGGGVKEKHWATMENMKIIMDEVQMLMPSCLNCGYIICNYLHVGQFDSVIRSYMCSLLLEEATLNSLHICLKQLLIHFIYV
jgi:lysyl-tRNA synthetase class I